MTRQSRRTRQLQVEQLEQRQLLAVAVASDSPLYDDSLPCISAEEVRQQQEAADRRYAELAAAIPESLKNRIFVSLMDSFQRIQGEVERPGSTGQSVESILRTGPYSYGWQRVSATGELLVSVQFDSWMSEADIIAKIAAIEELGLRAEPGDSHSPILVWVRPDQLETMAQIPGAVSFQAWQSMMITHVWYPPVPTRAPCESVLPPRDPFVAIPPALTPVRGDPSLEPTVMPLPVTPAEVASVAPTEAAAESTPPTESPATLPAEPNAALEQAVSEAALQLVGIRLALTDLDGHRIDTVTVGEAFRLSVYVDDLREAGIGVFASFIDVDFDTALVAPGGSVEYPTSHVSRQTYEHDATGIRRAGGALGMSYTTGEEQLLFTAAFTASEAGDLLFSTSPSHGIGMETLLFGIGLGIDPASISYGRAALRIHAAN